jgi:hypothetical protein
MAVYIVTYDLVTPDRDYTALHNAIRRFPHCHALLSGFFIDTPMTSMQVLNILRPQIDENDVLYVMRITREWAANRQMKCTAWLQAPARTF